MSKLCVSITEPDATAVLDTMKSLPKEVDIAEIRLDCIPGEYRQIKEKLRAICENRDRPVIVTNRPVKIGEGCCNPKRLILLKDAAMMGAEYVDIELESLPRLSLAELPTQTIVSYHNYENTPQDLERIYRQCRYSDADIVKIATMATDISDSARMLEFQRTHPHDAPALIAICMGEEGLATRILAPKFGGYLSFASPYDEKAAAPGQIQWREMLELYRFKSINKNTDIYGVAADPVSHSMSPEIHNAAFARTGENAVYLPLKVKDPATFLDAFQQLGTKGLSITIPHKEAMITMMDEIDEFAERAGALNTVNIINGRRLGYNTDISAALGALQKGMDKKGISKLADCKVLLIGAGGAGRALACGLSDSAGKLIIANRTRKRAEKLAEETGGQACGLDEMEGYRPDIIINTTSVGMAPNTNLTPIPENMLEHRPLVMDAVYNPIETRLLRSARKMRCVTVSGFDWFIRQATEQFRIWTGKEPPQKLMAEVLRTKLTQG